MKGLRPERTCSVSPDGVPTCGTGPFGRLTWTLRELAEMLRLKRPR